MSVQQVAGQIIDPNGIAAASSTLIIEAHPLAPGQLLGVGFTGAGASAYPIRITAQTDTLGYLPGDTSNDGPTFATTDMLLPSGTLYTLTLIPACSSPAQVFGPMAIYDETLPNGQDEDGNTLPCIGGLISSLMKPLTVQSGMLKFVYNVSQIVGAAPGHSYVDMTRDDSYFYNGAGWVQIGNAPSPALNTGTAFVGYGQGNFTPANILSPVVINCASVRGTAYTIPGSISNGNTYIRKMTGSMTTAQVGGTAPLFVCGTNFCGLPAGGPTNVALPAPESGNNALYWEAEYVYEILSYTNGHWIATISGRVLIFEQYNNPAPCTVITVQNTGQTSIGLGDYTVQNNAAFNGAGCTISVNTDILTYNI